MSNLGGKMNKFVEGNPHQDITSSDVTTLRAHGARVQ